MRPIVDSLAKVIKYAAGDKGQIEPDLLTNTGVEVPYYRQGQDEHSYVRDEVRKTCPTIGSHDIATVATRDVFVSSYTQSVCT